MPASFVAGFCPIQGRSFARSSRRARLSWPLRTLPCSVAGHRRWPILFPRAAASPRHRSPRHVARLPPALVGAARVAGRVRAPSRGHPVPDLSADGVVVRRRPHRPLLRHPAHRVLAVRRRDRGPHGSPPHAPHHPDVAHRRVARARAHDRARPHQRPAALRAHGDRRGRRRARPAGARRARAQPRRASAHPGGDGAEPDQLARRLDRRARARWRRHRCVRARVGLLDRCRDVPRRDRRHRAATSAGLRGAGHASAPATLAGRGLAVHPRASRAVHHHGPRLRDDALRLDPRAHAVLRRPCLPRWARGPRPAVRRARDRGHDRRAHERMDLARRASRPRRSPCCRRVRRREPGLRARAGGRVPARLRAARRGRGRRLPQRDLPADRAHDGDTRRPPWPRLVDQPRVRRGRPTARPGRVRLPRRRAHARGGDRDRRRRVRRRRRRRRRARPGDRPLSRRPRTHA